MDKSMEYGMMVVISIIIIFALWWFFFRKKKCKTDADCKKGQKCAPAGYCWVPGKFVPPKGS